MGTRTGEQPAGRELRVAVVGYGTAGRGFHGALLARCAGAVVSDVVTADAQRAAAAREDHPGARVHRSFADLLDAPGRPDLVVLATPNHLHVEQGLAAVERGLPLLVDKPLAVTAEGARRLVEAAERAGVPLTVFQNRRWDAEVRTLQRLLAERALGTVLRYESRFERWRPRLKGTWRETARPEVGGGLLLDLQSHLVDQAVLLHGPVETVYAEVDERRGAADDDTFLALRHRSGVRSHLWAGSLAAAPGPRLRVLGTAGAYVVADVAGEPTAFDALADADAGSRGWLIVDGRREPVARAAGSWEDVYPAVARWLRTGTDVPVDPRDAVAVLEVLDAARRSASTGQVVGLS